MNIMFIRHLYDYHNWANQRLWECVIQLDEATFLQDVNFSIGSVRNQLVHIMSAEWIWLSRLSGTSPNAMFLPELFSNREIIRQRWDELRAEQANYLASLSDLDLQRILHYTNTAHTKMFESTVAEILMHVINHTTDHRAQTMAVIHQLGGPTLEQDMIFFFRRKVD